MSRLGGGKRARLTLAESLASAPPSITSKGWGSTRSGSTMLSFSTMPSEHWRRYQASPSTDLVTPPSAAVLSPSTMRTFTRMTSPPSLTIRVLP